LRLCAPSFVAAASTINLNISPQVVTNVPTPPCPPARVHRVESPHGTREDPYYWLRDDTRTDPEVLAHLRAENEYTAAVLAPAQPLIAQLYEEIVGRLKQDDASVPVRHRGYWYVSRYETGREYPLYVRWPDVPQPQESVLLDCNVLAQGEAFFQLGDYEVSPDNKLMAYTVDTVGRRQYRLRIKDLGSGELLADCIDNVESDVAWSDDNRSFLYIEKDPVTLLGRRVRRHVLGTAPEHDAVVYEEADESFDLTVERGKSEKYLYIGAESTTSSEWRYAAADDPALQFTVFAPRTADHEYQIEHLDSRFVIRTNWNAENFRIMAVPLTAHSAHSSHAGREQWRDVVAHDPEVFVDDFDVFQDFLAVSERSGGLRKIRVQRWNAAAKYLAADDPAYTMRLDSNPEIDATKLRYSYTSLTTPASIYDYDVVTGERVLLKREPVLGNFDPADYVSEFQWAPARDGRRIPISLVYRKGVARDGTAPLYLYAYGAYGHCIDPTFGSARLSLLDRGFVYAIAHVRGGQELGRHWYDAGRLLHKWNTFNDFIDATDFLIAQGYSRAGRVYASGGSAGGLLVGTVINVAPEKYGGAIANVPFVDIVTTMLDESIPLTTLEYDEWGNPHQQLFYDYMLAYSPYDNVRRQSYPPVLATTGLWDSQVQYFEPAKWVAKLRALKTDGNTVLLHTNLEAGHGGKSGRFARLHEVAREYGFVVSLANSPGDS
jgi:oligopeptidase B